MEAKNPKRLKLSSFAEQRARPPITGIKESLTSGPVTSPETNINIRDYSPPIMVI